MMRNHTKLGAFESADEVAVIVETEKVLSNLIGADLD